MAKTKIQVGYGTGKPLSQKHGLYGNARNGKKKLNGGFDHCPVADFHNVPQERWEEIFGEAGKPWYERRDSASNS